MVHSITYVVLHMLSVVRIEPWFKFLSFDLVLFYISMVMYCMSLKQWIIEFKPRIQLSH